MSAAPRTVLTVEVRPPYPVHVGPGALGDAPALLPHPTIAVISDEHVVASHLEPLARALRAEGRRVVAVTVPPGEASKSLTRLETVLRALAEAGLERGDAVVGLGGGVVGDLAGFAAASYLRGVDLVQAPTSLLAMVDASIGGKTGVNLPEGKNLVGAFWQPKAVLMDVHALRTLPPRAFRQGVVEAYKTGLLGDAELAAAIEAGRLHPEADDATLTRLIAASARVKAGVVARDAREGGERAHLNLGHTAGHALEAASGHALPHGEAVAWGLLMAAHLARARFGTEGVDGVRALLRAVRPAPLPTRSWDTLQPYLRRDKKTRGGRRRWVLLRAPGVPVLVDDVDEAEERAAWEATLADAGALAGARDAAGPRREREDA